MNIGEGLSENERVRGWCVRLLRGHLERCGKRLKREHSLPTLGQGVETEQWPHLWRSLHARIERHTSNIQIPEEQSRRLARAINYLSSLLTAITPTVFS